MIAPMITSQERFLLHYINHLDGLKIGFFYQGQPPFFFGTDVVFLDLAPPDTLGDDDD
jgi:hypothetical protein